MWFGFSNLSPFFEIWMYLSPRGLSAESHDPVYNFALSWFRSACIPAPRQSVSLELCDPTVMESRWRPGEPHSALS